MEEIDYEALLGERRTGWNSKPIGEDHE